MLFRLRVWFAGAVLALAPLCASSQPAPKPPGPDIIFAKLPAAEMAEFKANPAGLLLTYVSAGLPLSTRTRDLLLTDNSLTDTLIDVARKGNGPQQTAMGTGVAEAAKLIARKNPQLAAEIQQKVLKSGLLDFISAFSLDATSTTTSSTSGGGGGGGGGGAGGGTGQVGGVSSGGGSGGGNSGSNSGSGSDSTANAFTGNSAPGSGGSSDVPATSNAGFTNVVATGGTTVTTTTSVSPSVSP